MDCLFCKIIDGSIPSKTIYEDDDIKVFLDINPSTNGDMLIIPKKHIVTIDEVDDELGKKLLSMIKEIKKLAEEKLNCDGITIVQNNGYGQEIKHFHIHITPRYNGDMLSHSFNKEYLKNIDDIFNSLTK